MERLCAQPWCKKSFVVTDDDRKFYDTVSPVIAGKKFSIPPPSLCPTCRQQRRLSWRNEHHLYRRTCDLCKKNIVAVHAPETPYPVYCVSCWWSDRWDPLSYGQPLDPQKPFLEQYASLQRRVPQLAIQNDNGISSENSEYCYDVSRAKNCYRLIGSWYDEECHYALNVNHCRCVIDSNTIGNSELAYECLDSQKLYHCAYLQNCENCHDCWYGIDLKGCNDCIACYGLRHKQYCIFNEQYSAEDYVTKRRELSLSSWTTAEHMRETFDAWALQFPRRHAYLQNCEGCTGNNLLNCKNVKGWSVLNAEDSCFIDRSDGPLHCYDLINTGGPQWCLDSVTPDDSYMTAFSVWCWKCKNTLLSDNCHSAEHLLGCIGVRRSSHCILNTHYTEDEYEHHASEILASLEKDGSWGALLPLRLSPFAYNESSAMEYYPLEKQTVIDRGWRWSDTLPYTTDRGTVAWADVPDRIDEVADTCTEDIYSCIDCTRNYRMLSQELSLYRALGVPLPRRCPHCRHTRRFRRKTPTELYDRSCSSCGMAVTTSYPPDRPEHIVCDACYAKAVY